MSVGLWCLCLSAALAAEPAEGQAVVPLAAGEAWYKGAKGDELPFEGVLERNPGSGKLGPPTRYNAYRLAWIDAAGHPGGREVYLPEKAYLLEEFLGRKVRLVGKAIDSEADGKTYRELWPARLEVLDVVARKPAPPAQQDGVYARCYWQPVAGFVREPRCTVFRSAAELVQPLRLSGGGAEEAATRLLAQRLNVADIDWKAQMLVSVSAGLKGPDADRLTVTRAVVKDRTLTVYYRLESPAGGAGGIGVPAETALVDRFDGDVRIEREPDRP
jgi:hypothetical protein